MKAMLAVRSPRLGPAVGIILAAVALVVLPIAQPAGAAGTVTITPNTALEDGDTVTFSGTGFAGGWTIFFCQGVFTGGTPTPANCGRPFQNTASDVSGAFSVQVTVDRFLVVPNIGVVDCASPQASCGLGATDTLGIPGAAAMSFTPQPPLETRIEGTVTDGAGDPVVGAPVWAFTSADTWIGSLRTTTDDSGSYVLEDAELGVSYRIAFGAPSGSGLSAEWYGGPSSEGVPSRAQAALVSLSPVVPVRQISAQLAAVTSITGTVTDPNGASVANVIVRAYSADDGLIGSYLATTASDGTYALGSVFPGVPVKIRFGPPSGAGLAAEWFDNSPNRAGAQPITLASGAAVVANAQLAAP